MRSFDSERVCRFSGKRTSDECEAFGGWHRVAECGWHRADKPEFVKFFVFPVLFPNFDSVVRRKQSFLFISPFVLPRSPMEATISRFSAYFVAFYFLFSPTEATISQFSAYFVAFCIPSRLRKQQFHSFQPILLPSAFRLACGSNTFPNSRPFCCFPPHQKKR